MVALVSLLCVCLAIAAVNGESMWQNPKCREQIRDFLQCKQKIFAWKEAQERLNKSKALYDECLEKNGCMRQSDVPHDLEWRKRKCAEDVGTVVRQKAVACVRLRVSPDFDLPEDNSWAFGRYSYEPVPLSSVFDSMCKRGDMNGTMKCYQEVSNHTRMSPEEYVAYYERGCARREECFKQLDAECLAKYDAYRQTFCECAYDVHDMYGGKRLLTLVPTCAGLINDKHTRYLMEQKQRDSCDLGDLNQRDGFARICEVGYEKYMKEMKEKMAKMFSSTTTTPAATTVKPSKGPK